MNYSKIATKWSALLSESQVDFVNALVVTQSVPMACEMANVPRALARKYLAAPKIKAALQMAKSQLREDMHVTPEEVISDLRLVRDIGLGRIPAPETRWRDGEPVTRYVRNYNAAAANKAIENLGRVVGMFTDRKEISIPATDGELKKRLEELLGTTLDITDANYTTVEDTFPSVPNELAGPQKLGSDDSSTLPSELVTPDTDFDTVIPAATPPRHLSECMTALERTSLNALLQEACDDPQDELT